MFCPNCGNQVPDGSVFCSVCGANTGAEPVATAPAAPAVTAEEPTVPTTDTPEPIIPDIQSVPMPPMEPIQQAVPPVQPPVAYQPRLGKGKYLRTIASKKAKTLSKVVWALFLAAVIILGLGTYSVISGSVVDIPVVAMAANGNTEQLTDELDILDDVLDDADEVLDDIKGELTDKEYKTIEKVLDDAKNFSRNPSISNTKAVIASLTEASEIAEKYPEQATLAKHFADADFAEEMLEPMMILDIVIYVVVGFAVFIALLILLAAALKKTGVALFSLVLAEVLCCIFAGAVYAVLIAAVLIAMMVVCIIINKEYRAYRKGC